MTIERDLPLLIGLVVAFAAAIFLAAAETSLLRTPPVRVASLAASGGARERRLAHLIDRLPQVLSAILLAALLSQIAAATLVGVMADRWFGSLGVTLSSVALTFLLFVYGEAIPKTYAVRHADTVALVLAVPIATLERILRPAVSVLTWFADLQMPGRGVDMSPTITEDELRRLASHAAVEGEITTADRELIERAFRFGDRRLDDVMVPRPDVIAVRSDASIDEAIQVVLEAGHRRLPVYDDNIENITGVVRLRELVGIPEERRAHVEVGAVADEPLIAPESKRVMALLDEMQGSGIHLAVVVDEFGGTAGIVTLEDIAEELLGSLRAEPVPEEIVEIDTNQWSFAAAVPVEDLAYTTGVELPDGDWNTVAGLVMGLSGRLPSFGDVVETDRLRLRVAGLRGRRMTRVEVTRLGDNG
jgi:CBS domain containing-hemolysin-like protein